MKFIGWKQSFSWVTLFEVLTAIMIFGTWILVLLSMIWSNVTRIRTIRLKDDATMLAKEWMEIMYNLRDSNLEKWLLWYCGEFNNSLASKCAFDLYQGWTWTNYIIDWTWNDTDDTMYELRPMNSLDEARLYFHTWTVNLSWWLTQDISWYNHLATWWEVTPYSRYVTIAPTAPYASHTWKILQLQVHVIADQWVRQYDVVLESLIWDTR